MVFFLFLVISRSAALYIQMLSLLLCGGVALNFKMSYLSNQTTYEADFGIKMG